MKYSIPECNIDALDKKLTRIGKKCAKYGNPFTYKVIGTEYKDVKDEKSGFTFPTKYFNIEVEGTAKVGEWQFVATLEHKTNGNVIRSYDTKTVIPERFRTVKCACEHCRTNRARKDTYIVKNDNGEFRQVGRNCLADYTNGLSANYVAGVMEYVRECEKSINEEYGVSGGYKRYYKVEEILLHAVELTRLMGFIPTSEIGCNTRTDLIMMMNNNPSKYEMDRFETIKNRNYNPARNEQIVEDMLKWISEKDTFLNNYMSSLKAICGERYAESRDFGLLASMPNTYFKAMEIAEKKKVDAKNRMKSGFVGEIGKKHSVNNCTAKCVYSFENSFNGYTDVTTSIYNFTDGNGNIFIWKTQKYIDCDKKYNITGTIKEHKEYKGQKQNVMTRCKLSIIDDTECEVKSDNTATDKSIDEFLNYFK